MNSVITGMYAKKAQHASIGSGTGNVTEKVCVIEPNSSGVSFSIDRTGIQPSHVVFESDEQQSCADLSDSVTVCDAAATAETRQEMAADDVIVIEDNHQQEVNASTNTPVPLAAVTINQHCSAQENLAVTHAEVYTDNILTFRN